MLILIKIVTKNNEPIGHLPFVFVDQRASPSSWYTTRFPSFWRIREFPPKTSAAHATLPSNR